jgi:hypothetical protein
VERLVSVLKDIVADDLYAAVKARAALAAFEEGR